MAGRSRWLRGAGAGVASVVVLCAGLLPADLAPARSSESIGQVSHEAATVIRHLLVPEGGLGHSDLSVGVVTGEVESSSITARLPDRLATAVAGDAIAAQPTAVPGVGGLSASAPGVAGFTLSLAGTPVSTSAGAVPGPAWRWRQYVAQRPRWSAAACTDETLDWHRSIATRGVRTECATVRAPLDWSDLTAGSITLGVTRVRGGAPSTTARRLLVVNPGGPGEVAEPMAPSLAAQFPGLLGTHDIVASDPRGAGRSTPLACAHVRDGLRDLRGGSTATVTAMQQATRATVTACAQQEGPLLAGLSTAAMAADLDLVRRVLGHQQMDFYGVSAGSWLGAHLARAHPSAVGRFVFDGNTQFTADWRTSFAWQPQGFQRRLDAQFFPWLARHGRLYGLGTTTAAVRASYEDVRASVGAGRIRGVTARDFDAMVAGHLYSDEGFLEIASQLQRMRGEAGRRPAAGWRPQTGLLGAGAYEANPSDIVFMAVQCNDSARRGTPNSYRDEGRALGRAYPLVGYEWLVNACAYWPFAPTPLPAVANLRPVLMVQTELDPATPWEGALRARLGTPRARMVAVEDQGGHGAYLSGNRCVARHVETYLTRGVLPARDQVCPGDPLPLDSRTYPVGWNLAAQIG